MGSQGQWIARVGPRIHEPQNPETPIWGTIPPGRQPRREVQIRPVGPLSWESRQANVIFERLRLINIRGRFLPNSVRREGREVNDLIDCRSAVRGRTGDYVQLLTGAQSRLYAYICCLVGESAAARDVLQETN